MPTVFVCVTAEVCGDFLQQYAGLDVLPWLQSVGRETGTVVGYHDDRGSWEICGSLPGIIKAHDLMAAVAKEREAITMETYHRTTVTMDTAGMTNHVSMETVPQYTNLEPVPLPNVMDAAPRPNVSMETTPRPPITLDTAPRPHITMDTDESVSSAQSSVSDWRDVKSPENFFYGGQKEGDFNIRIPQLSDLGPLSDSHGQTFSMSGKTFQCLPCQKTFANKGNLSRHMFKLHNIHTGKKKPLGRPRVTRDAAADPDEGGGEVRRARRALTTAAGTDREQYAGGEDRDQRTPVGTPAETLAPEEARDENVTAQREQEEVPDCLEGKDDTDQDRTSVDKADDVNTDHTKTDEMSDLVKTVEDTEEPTDTNLLDEPETKGSTEESASSLDNSDNEESDSGKAENPETGPQIPSSGVPPSPSSKPRKVQKFTRKNHPRPYTCADCGRSFGSHSNLSRHLHLVHNNKRIQCPRCPQLKTFSCRETMERHIKIYHDKLMCATCVVVFSSPADLHSHQCPGKKVGDYRCELCDKTYRASNNLKKHMKVVHEGHVWSCDACDKEYRSKDSLYDHYRFYHQLLKCIRCQEVLATEEELAAHMAAHGNKRPGWRAGAGHFPCEYCDKSYSTESRLQTHVNSAHPELSCQHCSATFRSRQQLLSHQRAEHKVGYRTRSLRGDDQVTDDSTRSLDETDSEDEDSKDVGLSQSPSPLTDDHQQAASDFVGEPDQHPQLDGQRTKASEDSTPGISQPNNRTHTAGTNGELPTPAEKDGKHSEWPPNDPGHQKPAVVNQFPASINHDAQNLRNPENPNEKETHKAIISDVMLPRCQSPHVQFPGPNNAHQASSLTRFPGQYPAPRPPAPQYPAPLPLVDPRSLPLACHCGEMFSSRKLLTRHQSQRHNERTSFLCPFCAKEFLYESNMKRHVRREHEGQRFVCDDCGREFLTSSRLNEHKMADHHGIFINCQLCSKKFKTKYRFASHMKNVHKTAPVDNTPPVTVNQPTPDSDSLLSPPPADYSPDGFLMPSLSAVQGLLDPSYPTPDMTGLTPLQPVTHTSLLPAISPPGLPDDFETLESIISHEFAPLSHQTLSQAELTPPDQSTSPPDLLPLLPGGRTSHDLPSDLTPLEPVRSASNLQLLTDPHNSRHVNGNNSQSQQPDYRGSQYDRGSYSAVGGPAYQTLQSYTVKGTPGDQAAYLGYHCNPGAYNPPGSLRPDSLAPRDLCALAPPELSGFSSRFTELTSVPGNTAAYQSNQS